ncbi:MAG: zinc ribbon domain-containing protein [Actinobacteria bacterium]|nr:zinc ribbon domain-containing protein [Actinomycetota bacterium]
MKGLGPCTECGNELAADQRYCIECGHRVEAPLAPTYLPTGPPAAVRRSGGWPLPIPMSTAGLFAAMALGFGVIAGTAISPNLSGLIAGEYLAQDDGDRVTQVPDDGKDKKDKGGGGGSGSGSFDGSSGFGSGFFGSSGFGSFGGGSGSGSSGDGRKDTGGVRPGPDTAKPVYVSGTVIFNNPVAGSYSVSSGGAMSAIHTDTSPKMPVPGTKVKIPVRQLANRTYAEHGKRQINGEATKATFTGIVTDSRGTLVPGARDTYTVSGHGSSVLVYGPDDPTGTLMPPTVGKIVTVTTNILGAVPPPPAPAAAPPAYSCPIPSPAFPRPAVTPVRQLQQGSASGDLVVQPTEAKTASISTVVQATCSAAPKQFLFSSDSIRERMADISPFADSGVLLSGVTSAEPIIASVTLKPATNEVIEVNGTASDNGIAGADDASTAQGNLVAVEETTTEDAEAAQAALARAIRRALP